MATLIAADLYGDVSTHHGARWREFLPGLTVVALGTLAAAFLASQYGVPLTLMALLVGLSLNFLATDRRLHPGLGFASHTLLRWGIVLIGLRVTAAQVLGLGPAALLSVALILTLTIAAGMAAARWFGLGKAFGVLAGGAVAICGASAAMALATTLGPRRVRDETLALVLVGISAMSAAAMIAYPIVAHALALSDVQAGFLLGASIHDIGQALGAGYAYSNTAGEHAAIVKLTRVALLAPVLAIVAFFLPGERTPGARVAVPWFVIGFFALAGINSLGVIPPVVADVSGKAATAFLAAAVTATAIRSPLARLMQSGVKPILTIFAATAAAFALSLIVALLIVR